MAEKTIDELLDKHLEQGGIDPSTQDSTTPAAEPTAETTNEPEATITTPEADETPKADTESKTPEVDSTSGKPDSATEQGKKPEAKDTARPGDLTLPDGSIVRAGAERRHYETLQVTRQQLQARDGELTNTRNELNTVKAKLEAYDRATTELNGVDPVQAASAVKLYRDLVSDTPGTLQKLIVEAKAKGYSIEGAGAGIDTAAIIAALGSQNRPQVETPQVDYEKQAQEETATFLSKYPDANLHTPEMTMLVQSHPDKTLEEIYFALKTQVVANGLDWSKPLQPQITARKQQQIPAPVIPPVKPLTNGRGPDVFAATDLTTDPKLVQGDSTEDIIREAMREAGMLKQ